MLPGTYVVHRGAAAYTANARFELEDITICLRVILYAGMKLEDLPTSARRVGLESIGGGVYPFAFPRPKTLSPPSPLALPSPHPAHSGVRCELDIAASGSIAFSTC